MLKILIFVLMFTKLVIVTNVTMLLIHLSVLIVEDV